MAPVPISGHILKALPFRETSFILHVFSSEFGLVHCCAKGVRKAKSSQPFLERGFHIETSLYYTPTRDLHTCSAITVLDFYDGIRKNLVKASIRDVYVELLGALIRQEEKNPALSAFLHDEMTALNAANPADVFPVYLWHFLFRLSEISGFSLGMNHCSRCGKDCSTDSVYPAVRSGGCFCRVCAGDQHQIPALSVSVKHAIANRNPAILEDLSLAHKVALSKVLVTYCRYHGGCNYPLRSLEFLQEIIGF